MRASAPASGGAIHSFQNLSIAMVLGVSNPVEVEVRNKKYAECPDGFDTFALQGDLDRPDKLDTTKNVILSYYYLVSRVGSVSANIKTFLDIQRLESDDPATEVPFVVSTQDIGIVNTLWNLRRVSSAVLGSIIWPDVNTLITLVLSRKALDAQDTFDGDIAFSKMVGVRYQTVED